MATTIMNTILYRYNLCANPFRVRTSLHYLGIVLEINSYNRAIQFLYPSLNYSNNAGDNKTDGALDIPVDRLKITYSRSSGPGGQHVNKVNTKAEVRFHVTTADWIPEEIKNKILLQHKNRINKAGEFQVTSEASRSQQQNLNDCLRKICDIITEASQKPHEPTAEDVALRKLRLQCRNKERLKDKKMQSALKQSRKVDFD